MPSILALNAGSSSLKFALFDCADEPVRRLSGQISGIDGAQVLSAKFADGRAEKSETGSADALGFILDWLKRQDIDPQRLDAMAHRIVHGGTRYVAPVNVTDEIAADLDRCIALAPLHMPAGMSVLHRMRAAAPNVPQIACFDTAFHATQPEEATRLPLPQSYHDRGYRRYGFHGLNYEHVIAELPRLTGKPLPARLVVAHLGNGASMCAIKHGKSIATTMGYSTADGLIMGTRTGSIDPGLLIALMRDDRMSTDELDDLIYRRAGLLGLSGISSDMRTLLEDGSAAARFAIECYCYAAARHVGSFAAALDGVDTIVFTGGVGENAAQIRENILVRLKWLGPCPHHVVPANEELTLARHAIRLMN